MKLVDSDDGRELPVPGYRTDRLGRRCLVEALVSSEPGAGVDMVLISHGEAGAHKVAPEELNARLVP